MSSESSEPAPCGKRCRRCNTFREKRVSKRCTQAAGVNVVTSVIQSFQNVVFFGHHFTHGLGRMQRWHVAKLAPAQCSGKSREEVG